MARDFSRSFYKSDEWQTVRQAYIRIREGIDGGMCELCGKDYGYIVHHKVWLTPDNINDPYIALDHQNLMYVCTSCHTMIHVPVESEEKKATPLLSFDRFGNPVRPGTPLVRTP